MIESNTMKNNIKYILVVIYCFIINTSRTMQETSDNYIYHFNFDEYNPHQFDSNSPFGEWLTQFPNQETYEYAKKTYEQTEKIGTYLQAEAIKAYACGKKKFEETSEDREKIVQQTYKYLELITEKVKEITKAIMEDVKEKCKATYQQREQITQTIYESFEKGCKSLQEGAKAGPEDVTKIINKLKENSNPTQPNADKTIPTNETIPTVETIPTDETIPTNIMEPESFFSRNKNLLISAAAIATAATVLRFCYYKYLQNNNNDDK
jgi:hypothetical protein